MPESFLQDGPSQLLQDFFNSLPDHQIDIRKDSTALSCLEIKMDNAAIALRTQLTEVCSDPALMLNFEPSMQGITTIDLTQEETIVKFPPLRGNIALPWKDYYEGYDIIPDNTSSVREDPWACIASAAPSGEGSAAPITVTSTSAQLPSPLEAEKATFPLSSVKRVKNLVLKENTNITLASIGADKVASRVDATTTQAFDAEMKTDSSDEESDGDDTDLDYGGNKRVSVLSNEEDEEGE